MPDATITSTASTFGTITGTFAADQSTVTGTVTGIVAGTLSGSVGVPGPQGATGSQGPQGIQGVPGSPGQGVPVGGSAGQFLTKIDGTNYNTDWTTVNLSVYAVKANNLSDLADAPTARTNLGLGTMSTATASDYSTTVAADGLYYPLVGNPSGFLTSVPPPTLTNLTSDISWDVPASIGRLIIAGVNDIGGGNTEGRLNFQSAVPNVPVTGDFWFNGTYFFYRESGSTKTIASESYVSATYQPLSGMSSYLTTASAASTYAVIAAGQPVAGSTGQVLTKNSGTNYDSIWATPVVGDRYLTSSTTSNTLSNTTKTFTIGTGLSYTPTQNITISYDASNHMHGEVLTYNSGTGVLTVDINHHTGSGTYAAWVVNVGGVTPATSVAFADITGAVSGNANLQAALDLKLDVTTAASTYFTIASAASKANLASPTFTGTPTLPTGTIGVTQSPGNNTTALATTAFVTAAVPAIATINEVVAATSITTSLAPGTQGFALTNPRLQPLAFINQQAVNGSGASSSNQPQTFSRQIYLSTLNVGRSAYIFGLLGSGPNTGFGTSTTNAAQVDFSKKVWISGYAMMGFSGSPSYMGDANTTCRITLGGYSTLTTGNMTLKGIGLKKVGGAASTVSLTVHNGTTLTDVASSVTVPDGGGIHWQIYSDGTGNVTLYINGTQAATTTAGPTTATASGNGCYREQVEAVATPGVRQIMNCNGGWFYSE